MAVEMTQERIHAVLERYRLRSAQFDASAARRGAGEDSPVLRPETFEPVLSSREIEVLVLTSEGLTAKEIAGFLVLGRETVVSHLTNVRRKLGARNKAHAVAIVLRRPHLLRGVSAGLLGLPPVAAVVVRAA